jgi:hypothetical protein
MTSYEVSIGFWAIGHTFHAFYGPFRCLSSRELVSTIPEDRMTPFITLTVPTPRTDHILMPSTTRVGLRPRRFWILWLREKRPFRAIFVSYDTRFSAPRSTFSKPPGFLPNLWRNVSFCRPEWLIVILGWKCNETGRKRLGTCTLWPKNQWEPHKMSSTRFGKNLGGFEKVDPGAENRGS